MKVAADQCGLDTRIECGAVKRDQTAFSVAGHADRDGALLVTLCKPIYCREDLLHFVADNVTAHLVRHSVDPFAMRLVSHTNSGNAGPRVRPVDEYRNEHFTTVLCQTPRVLCGCIYSRDYADQHFGGPVGIGNGDNSRYRRAIRFEQHAFTIDAFKYGPAHGVDFVAGAGADCRRFRGRGFEPNGRGREPLVHSADDRSQVIAVRCDGLAVPLGGPVVPSPELLARVNRGRGGAIEVAVDAFHHLRRQVAA